MFLSDFLLFNDEIFHLPQDENFQSTFWVLMEECVISLQMAAV